MRKMDTPLKQDTENHGLAIRYALRAYTRALTLVAKDLNISAGQYRVLRTLGTNSGLTQLELAQLTAMDRPFLSLTIKQLRQADLVRVRRGKDDRRRVDVLLTAKGATLRERLLKLVRRSDEIAVSDVSSDDLHTFHVVLAKMTINVERYCEQLEDEEKNKSVSTRSRVPRRV